MSEKEESTFDVYHAEVDGWEINTMMARADTKEELDAGLNFLKAKYGKQLFSIVHIPKRERLYYHAVIVFNMPLVDIRSINEEMPE